MKRSTKSIIGFSVLFVFIGLIIFLESFNSVVVISEDKAQSELSKVFPLEFEKFGANFVLTDQTVKFLDDGLIQSSATLSSEFKGRQAKGSAVVLSKLRYESFSGSFYLDNISVQSFELHEFETKANDRKMLSGLLSKAANKIGVTRDVLDSFIRENIPHVQEYATAKIREKLHKTPIYTLDTSDAKQTIAKLAISKIEVSDSALNVHISWGSAFLKLLVYGLGCLLLIVVGAGLLFIGSGAAIAVSAV